MDKLDIYKKIVEVNERKNKHLKEYSDALDRMVESNSEFIFMTGGCEECDKYNKEIEILESILEKK